MSSDEPNIITDKVQQWWYSNPPLYSLPYHRDNDKPAMVFANGRKEWWHYGRRHRETGPAIICEDGTKEWWFNGKLHRIAAPAIVHPNGGYEWYLHGNRHRDNDLPAVVTKDPLSADFCTNDDIFITKCWWSNGLRHRVNAPAIIYNSGDKHWYNHGNLHREDGPATETNDIDEWWINGERHRENNLPAIIVKIRNLPPDNIFMKYEWWLYNMRHREGDQPAIIWSNGKMEWWFKGREHRENDKPAVIDPPFNLSAYLSENLNSIHFDESICNKEWWYKGKLHRECDKPSIVIATKKIYIWMVNGQAHREHGQPAYINEEQGITEWWFNGDKISKEHADFLKKRSRKLVLKYQWLWEDYAYRFGSISYFKRLEREMDEDMNLLEEDVGYKFSTNEKN